MPADHLFWTKRAGAVSQSARVTDMNHYQRYFLDEFVEDFRDGRLNRRDFILRAIAVSGGLTAAASLLRSLGLTDADVAAAQAAPAASVLNQASAVTVLPDDPEIRVGT